MSCIRYKNNVLSCRHTYNVRFFLCTINAINNNIPCPMRHHEKIYFFYISFVFFTIIHTYECSVAQCTRCRYIVRTRFVNKIDLNANSYNFIPDSDARIVHIGQASVLINFFTLADDNAVYHVYVYIYWPFSFVFPFDCSSNFPQYSNRESCSKTLHNIFNELQK